MASNMVHQGAGPAFEACLKESLRSGVPSTSKSWLWENIPSSWTSWLSWGYRNQAGIQCREDFPATVVNPTFWGLSYTPWTLHSTVLLVFCSLLCPGRHSNGLEKYFKDTVGHACYMTFHFPNNKSHILSFYPIFINILMECMTLWGIFVFSFLGAHKQIQGRQNSVPQDGLLCCKGSGWDLRRRNSDVHCEVMRIEFQIVQLRIVAYWIWQILNLLFWIGWTFVSQISA